MKPDLIYVYGTGKNSDEWITFGVDPEELLSDYDLYEKFIKDCENAVRKEDRYSTFVGEMKKAGMISTCKR